MADKEIYVVCHAGYRGEERPRAFLLGDKRIEVASIAKEWVEEGARDRTRRRFFKVRDKDGFSYTLWYDEKASAWFLR